jgi:stearoyl-CoA desaturase (delta-9 desaturase)
VIDFFAKIGWAYDRKYASNDMIKRKATKSGDGSHFLSHENAHKTSLFGLNDKDMDKDDLKELNALRD